MAPLDGPPRTGELARSCGTVCPRWLFFDFRVFGGKTGAGSDEEDDDAVDMRDEEEDEGKAPC